MAASHNLRTDSTWAHGLGFYIIYSAYTHHYRKRSTNKLDVSDVLYRFTDNMITKITKDPMILPALGLRASGHVKVAVHTHVPTRRVTLSTAGISQSTVV